MNMASQLKLYTDKQARNALKRLSFPRTEIGDKATQTVYIHNSSEKWPIMEIKHNQTNKDISVTGIPQQLRPNETVPINVIWKPSINTDDPLSGILDIASELHIG